jgi:hypothetical protein
MISSLASVVGLHANETRTALEERWSDRRFMYALYTLTALLPGRANERRYMNRLRQRGDGSNAATQQTSRDMSTSRPMLSMATADYRGDWIGSACHIEILIVCLSFGSLPCRARPPTLASSSN